MQSVAKEKEQEFSFLQGGGEMGALTRSYNWSQTSIGRPEFWPQSLQTTLGIILNSRFPMFLWWGDELVQFYNDAYRPSLGNEGKHPLALGQRGEECWPEIWPVIKPLIDQVRSGGGPTWSEDQLIPIYRNGQLEDVYWTFGYSPVNDENGKIGGVLVVCNETTEKVINFHKLVDSKQQLEFAMEATELATWDFNPVTNTFTANGQYEEWFGMPVQNETDIKLALNVIADEDRERVITAVNKALQYPGKEKYDIQYKIRPKGKPERILRAQGKAWFNDENKAYRFNGTLQDITDFIVNRQKIEESEQQVRSFVDSAPFPIGVYIGKERRIQLANQSMLNTWGKGKDVIGKLYAEVLPELNNPEIFQQLDQVYTSGEPYHAKDQRIDIEVDGKLQTYYFNYSFTPLFNASGDVYGVMNTAANVTDLHIAHYKVEESERNLRNVILQAPVAMCILRGDKYIVDIANDRMLEFWGKDGESVLKKPIFEGLHEAKGQGFEELLHQVYHNGETVRAYGVPAVLPRKGGVETVYIDFVYEAFREADGDISGVMVIAVEVTDQFLARKKIEESEARFRLMADTMPQFVWTSDPYGNLNYYNQAVFNYSGLSFEEIQKVGWLDIVHPDDREENTRQWMHAITTGEDFLFSHRFRNKHGNHRWQLSRAVPQRDENGDIQLWIGTSTDIHDQKLFEEELNRQVKERTIQLEQKNLELESINLELEQFSYAASHDMQEPLRKVNTFTTFLLENHAGQLDERGKSYLHRISTSVYRMKTIIGDLLNYSRQSQMEQEFVPVNLNKIVEHVETDLEVLMEQKQTSVIKDELPVISGVPTQMNQLFSNLFSNALKFTKAGVPVKIQIKSEIITGEEVKAFKELDPQNQYVKISFIDNGIGFEQQYASQIFSLFKRLHGRNEYEGTGIGLGLCKKIVQNHKGTIWAESEPGLGASIYILLPIKN